MIMPDLLERQNNLLLELLKEQKRLICSVAEVQTELKETKDIVDRLVEANEYKEEDKTKKRKYPSSLTVYYQGFMAYVTGHILGWSG